MSATLTLAELMIAARQRADMENSQFITDSELISLINQSSYKLYNLLIQSYGDDYFVADPYEFTANGTDTLYPLPDNFLKLLGVDLISGTTQATTLLPFNLKERNKYANGGSTAPYSVTRYRISGKNIWFAPKPSAGSQFRLYYVPTLPVLADPSDTLEGVSGYTEFVILDVAIEMLLKEESPIGDKQARLLELKQDIISGASQRDITGIHTVTDVYGGAGYFSGVEYDGF